MARKDVVGRCGEDLAAAYLERQGWVVLERNWRCAAGELDILALQGSDLVAVEVKTRTGLGFGHPAESVTARKVGRLRRLVGQWLAEHDLHPTGVRIDVIAVLLSDAPVLEHLVGVT